MEKSQKKTYHIIYADPPWRYDQKTVQGAAEDHHPTVGVDAPCVLPVRTLAAKDCLMFLWAMFPMLPEALRPIQAWGSTLKTVAFVWLKRNKKSLTWFHGLGHWTRSNAEICLLVERGYPKRYSRSVYQSIISPIEEHSKKSDITREKIIEFAGDLPRAELFAGQKTPGWDVWGNEAGSDSSLSAPETRWFYLAYVTAPKDFTKVKSKVVFGLTKRQLICFSGALLVGIPLFLLIRGCIPTSAAALLMVLAMPPGFLLALYECHGQPLEVAAHQTLECCSFQPKERPYQVNNAYTALVRQFQMEQEVNAIVQRAKKRSERKSADQAHPCQVKRNSSRHPQV